MSQVGHQTQKGSSVDNSNLPTFDDTACLRKLRLR